LGMFWVVITVSADGVECPPLAVQPDIVAAIIRVNNMLDFIFEVFLDVQ